MSAAQKWTEIKTKTNEKENEYWTQTITHDNKVLFNKRNKKTKEKTDQIKGVMSG